MVNSILFIFVALAGPFSHAQIESDSLILLRSSRAEIAPEDLDTTRYKIRAPMRRQSSVAEVKKVVEPAPAPAPEAVAAPAGAVEVELPPAPPAAAICPPAGVLSPEPEAETKLWLAPLYLNADSSSNYSLRRYHVNSPGLGLGLSVWLTPTFGLQANYLTSVSASIGNGEHDTTGFSTSTLELGMRLRRELGDPQRPVRLTYGLDFHDSQDRISRDSMYSLGHTSTGASLSIEAEIPVNEKYAHTLALKLQPYLRHTETRTGIEAHSGPRAETNALALDLGGEWTTGRRNKMFWRSEVRVERNLFNGAADTPDPQSGVAPTGVTVTETTSILFLGFIWGA